MPIKTKVYSPSPVVQISSYQEAEQQFCWLLTLENLNKQVKQQPFLSKDFEEFLCLALTEAYTVNSKTEQANRFLQRLLYRINRLKLFWYDALESYTNECSSYITDIRDRIELVWQAWELTQLDLNTIKQLNVKQALQERANLDLSPPLSTAKRYLREDMDLEGYRLLLAIASLDGLVEASRLSRIVGIHNERN